MQVSQLVDQAETKRQKPKDQAATKRQKTKDQAETKRHNQKTMNGEDLDRDLEQGG